MNLVRDCLGALLLLGAGCHANDDNRPCANWSQWGQNSGHLGGVCIRGQSPAKVLASVAVDPFGSQETAAASGDLLVHYQVPIIVGNDVYVLAKTGSFTPPCDQPDGGGELACYAWSSQVWTESRYHWSGGKLIADWTVTSNWKPVPSEFATSEPTFQPVVAGAALYLPDAAGTLLKVDRLSGATLAHLDPFNGAADPDRYVSGPLSTDSAGNVYYNVLKLDHDQPYLGDSKAWLVRVTPDDVITSVTYDTLVTGAPTGTSCHGTFAAAVPPPPLPWPPPPNADGTPVLPPAIDCGAQRPGLNVAPAVGADGTIFTVSRAHRTSQDSFVVALNPDLTTRWVASLRDILNDACGAFVPSDGDAKTAPRHCRPGTPMGVDRVTNQKPAGLIIDQSSSSPVALPDGGVLYGAYSSYNGFRGHVFKFTAAGKPAGTYDFGWDYTPAVWQHDGTYSIVVKDNHYNYDDMGTPLGPYFVTQLDANLQVEWKFQNTNIRSCAVDKDGKTSCVADHPYGFEWCINAPAIDKDGTVFAGGEDGVVYAIGQGGVDRGHLFLSMSLGASYTPLSIDRDGRLYTQNDGKLVVVGR